MNHAVAMPLLSTVNDQAEPYFWRDGWSNEEIEKLVEHCEALPKQPAQISSGVDATIRRGQIAWVPVNDASRWFMDRIGNQVMQLNRDYFGLDLWGFESAQYTVYTDEGKGSMYDWHVDMMGKGNTGQRKLSLVMQLSNSQDYEGGELWLHGATQQIVPKQKGLMVLFPSFILHRVTPVTSGLRRTLVAWVLGPQYR
jgi:PKHD-type hydroxylase